MPPRPAAKAAKDPAADNKNFGKVPKYIEKYKGEAKAKEDAIAERKAAKARNQPPGTRLMSDEERLKTLADLKENEKTVNGLLMKLPISMKT